jgi:hypothetical protein
MLQKYGLFFNNTLELDENFFNAKYNFEIIKNHQRWVERMPREKESKNQNLWWTIYKKPNIEMNKKEA